MMTSARMGEIAILFLKQQMRQDGIKITSNFRREIGSRAKVLGITTDEGVEFARTMINELFAEALDESADPQKK